MPDRLDDGQRVGAPHLYLFITMVLFGAAFTSSKVVVGQMPHDVAAALRFGGGAVVLLALLRLRAGWARFSWRDLIRAGVVGLIGVFAYNFLFFWGLSLAPAIDGSVIVPVFSPVLTTLVFLVTGREAASSRRLAGLVVAVLGAVVFFVGVAGTGSELTGPRLVGDLIYLLAAGCWAAYSMASKRVLSGMEPLRATTYATGVGALALIVVSLPSLFRIDWSGVHANIWGNIIFLAVGPTAVAYLFYYRGLRSVSPVTATITMFAVPVFGTISSVIFLGESITVLQIVGGLITIGGALLAVAKGRRHGPDDETRATLIDRPAIDSLPREPRSPGE